MSFSSKLDEYESNRSGALPLCVGTFVRTQEGRDGCNVHLALRFSLSVRLLIEHSHVLSLQAIAAVLTTQWMGFGQFIRGRYDGQCVPIAGTLPFTPPAYMKYRHSSPAAVDEALLLVATDTELLPKGPSRSTPDCTASRSAISNFCFITCDSRSRQRCL